MAILDNPIVTDLDRLEWGTMSLDGETYNCSSESVSREELSSENELTDEESDAEDDECGKYDESKQFVQLNHLTRVTEVDEEECFSTDDEEDSVGDNCSDEEYDVTCSSDDNIDCFEASNDSLDCLEHKKWGDWKKSMNGEVNSKRITDADTRFLRLEQMREELEREIGLDLLVRCYNIIQVSSRDNIGPSNV